MPRRYINFPVDSEHKKFCDFMGYSFISETDSFFMYKVPHNHICRFLINYENWRQGTFDKEAFIKLTEI